MIIELIIGGTVAGFLFWRQHELQKKLNKIISDEEKLRSRRKKFALKGILDNLPVVSDKMQEAKGALETYRDKLDEKEIWNYGYNIKNALDGVSRYTGGDLFELVSPELYEKLVDMRYIVRLLANYIESYYPQETKFDDFIKALVDDYPAALEEVINCQKLVEKELDNTSK